MTARIEWRTKGEGRDAVVYVGEFGEDSNTVLRTWEATPALLADYLNDMLELSTDVSGLEVDVDQRSPDDWGTLVIARASDGGDVLEVDPEPYWDGIYYWFRKHGVDPHPAHRHHS